MTFLGGVLVGGVVGFGAAALLGRRGGRSSVLAPEIRSSVAMIIAALALVVAAVALARNDREDHSRSAAPSLAATSTSTTATKQTSTTTPATGPGATLIVPNVVGRARSTAVATLERAGLRVSVDTLALANVPPGFVISQNPLPAGLVTAGTTVTLVVSAAT